WRNRLCDLLLGDAADHFGSRRLAERRLLLVEYSALLWGAAGRVYQRHEWQIELLHGRLPAGWIAERLEERISPCIGVPGGTRQDAARGGGRGPIALEDERIRSARRNGNRRGELEGAERCRRWQQGSGHRQLAEHDAVGNPARDALDLDGELEIGSARDGQL